MKGQWSGTVVMILQPGEERVMGAQAMLDDGLFTRFPKPDYLLAFHDSASLPAGAIGVPRLRARQRRYGQHRREGRRRPRRLSAEHQGSDRPRVAHRHGAQTLVSRENDPQTAGRGHGRQLPCRHQEQHHLRRREARADRAQLYARNAQAPARRNPPDRPRRGNRGRDARGQDADGRDRAAFAPMRRSTRPSFQIA